MKVFVTGGTGVIGRRLVPQLVAAGHDVTAVVRSDDSARAVQAMGAQPLPLDLFDPAAVAAAVPGSEVLINLATSIPPYSRATQLRAWSDNDRLRREASRNLVDAALAAGVQRYLQESVTFLYEAGGADWITEEQPVRSSPITASALDAEAQARRFGEAGGTAVVLRFASLYGHDSSHTLAAERLARLGLGSMPGPADGYVSSLATDDAATATLAALTAPAGIFNVADDEPLTRTAYHQALADAVGRRRLRPLPGWLTRLSGDKLDHFLRSQRVCSAALRDATGWKPRYPSVREGFSAVVAALRAG